MSLLTIANASAYVQLYSTYPISTETTHSNLWEFYIKQEQMCSWWEPIRKSRKIKPVHFSLSILVAYEHFVINYLLDLICFKNGDNTKYYTWGIDVIHTCPHNFFLSWKHPVSLNSFEISSDQIFPKSIISLFQFSEINTFLLDFLPLLRNWISCNLIVTSTKIYNLLNIFHCYWS